MLRPFPAGNHHDGANNGPQGIREAALQPDSVFCFAGIGLVLVSVGVYSVISYTVTQRRQEIGIRIALGASEHDVRSLVLGSGLRFILVGVGIGLFLAFFVGRVLASQVWGVAWYDPITLGGVTVVFTIVGLVASYLP